MMRSPSWGYPFTTKNHPPRSVFVSFSLRAIPLNPDGYSLLVRCAAGSSSLKRRLVATIVPPHHHFFCVVATNNLYLVLLSLSWVMRLFRHPATHNAILP